MAEIKEIKVKKKAEKQSDDNFVQEVLNDFRICCESREASLMARKEVLTGKAKFGIAGAGKEVAQVALARAMKKGDWRSGYYRDQTLLFALGLSSLEAYFAQLYADAVNDPFSGGRQMNCHFGNRTIDKSGNWISHTKQYNISSDISSTAGQMARGLGLALASKKYRNLNKLHKATNLSKNGNEVVFCTIGDASTSEGVFWESLNAAGVVQVPLCVSVWDDGYGISVPRELQTINGSISEALDGFQNDQDGKGLDIYTAYGWDYPGLCEIYENAVAKTRANHSPCLVHVKEVTQPQGHSTSGSHERYKSKERLEWETEFDGIKVMGEWMVKAGLASEAQVENIKEEAKETVKIAKNNAWKAFLEPTKIAVADMQVLLEGLVAENPGKEKLTDYKAALGRLMNPVFSEVVEIARKSLFFSNSEGEHYKKIQSWVDDAKNLGRNYYERHLYSETDKSALSVAVVPPVFSEKSESKSGYEILNENFDYIFKNRTDVLAFGEDVGNIGGVNQGFANLQNAHGEERVFDTGIREWTIMGQAIGLSMRGFRPIAEIQYLDYLIYALSPLSDDLATLRWRSNGQQMAPAIIRTRGSRLEGIWHSGSPMGMLVNSLRGMYICTPRDMVQAAGMYNTLLQSNDPALIVESLNGYRLKERKPDNIGSFTVPLGVPEILKDGSDITLITYSSMVRVALKAVDVLNELGVSVELVDVQTLLPFDLEHQIADSLKKTNRVLFLDEDVPGGASAYMMQEVLEKQNGYAYLDSEPRTLSAKAHRPPYGSDGDYFSKPSVEDIVEEIMEIMKEAQPYRFK